ncbi:MAG: prepilin-type N-terminal cleavage/methylation domain-containing protein [Deltaproteobacteria bacterium]|nr:prepilin-type N-terminal cleavage/methylation domain-containing protein [Deltaproteobacteria bacterium]
MKTFILKPKAKYQDGFGLIEVLIAMAVLSIGLLSIAALQTSAIRGNAKSNNLTERTTAASNHIEYLLNLPFTDPDLTAGAHNPEGDGIDNDGDGVTDEADDDGESGYTVTWNVTDNTSNEKTITLTLTGTDYGLTRTITMNTVRVR